MKLTKLYESILNFAGLEPDEQGCINASIDGRKKEPTMINGARLVMPIDIHLRNFVPGEKMIFHPLTENILRGESDVIQKLKQIINIKLNFTIGVVAQSLLNIVSSPELHSKLTPEQSELLMAVKDADEKADLNFVSCMVNGAKTRPDRLFTNIYLKRGGALKGKRFARAGIVSFPFFQELKAGKVEKIRVKDIETFTELFRFIFPDIDNSEEYNYGSSSQVAPYLDSLMKTAAKVALRLNDIIGIYKDFIDNADILLFDLNWIETFDDLEAMLPEIRKIPVQFGNDGNIDVPDPQPEQQPMQQMPQQQMQPMYPPQQQMQPMYPQQQMPPQQFQPPPRPEVKQTKRGLDFKSIVMANPGLAYIPNALGTQLQNAAMAARMQPQQYPPGFSAPAQQYPQGMPPPMYPQQGYPQPMPPQMYPQQGYPMDPRMMPQQGYPQQGYPQNPNYPYQGR